MGKIALPELFCRSIDVSVVDPSPYGRTHVSQDQSKEFHPVLPTAQGVHNSSSTEIETGIQYINIVKALLPLRREASHGNTDSGYHRT